MSSDREKARVIKIRAHGKTEIPGGCMKKRIALVLGVVALAGVALTTAFYVRAQGRSGWQGGDGWHGRGGRPSIERIVDHIGDRLDLTTEQRAQVNSIIAAERTNVEPMFAQLKANWQQMRAATAGGQFNEEQVRGLAANQAQTITELLIAKERVKAKVYAVLTPEQRTKADAMLDRFESRFDRGFANRS
jgi:Spy/CpxP family protein refolding chaperone